MAYKRKGRTVYILPSNNMYFITLESEQYVPYVLKFDKSVRSSISFRHIQDAIDYLVDYENKERIKYNGWNQD